MTTRTRHGLTGLAALALLLGLSFAAIRLQGAPGRPTAAALTSTDHLERSWDLEPAAAPAAVTAPAAPAEAPSLRERLRRLAEENAQLRATLDRVLAWILDNFQGRVPVNTRLMGRLRLPAMTDDAALDPDLAEFLQVTPAEEGQVNLALDRTRALLQTVESRVLRTEAETEGAGGVVIPPYPGEGLDIRTELYADLDGILGTPRMEKFCAVAEEDLVRRMGWFGEAERRLRFEARTGADGRPVLFIRDQTARTDEAGVRHIEARELLLNEVTEPYRPYLDRLVASMAPGETAPPAAAEPERPDAPAMAPGPADAGLQE